MWSRRLAEAQVISVRFGVPPPVMLAVAEWLRRRAVTPATRVRFSPVNPIFGVMLLGGRLVASRQSLKLTSGVRFAPSQPQPGRSAARTLLSDSRCRWFESIPGCHFENALSGYRSRDRIERYERSDCRSSRHTRTNPAFVQAGEDAALRTLKFRFESGGLDQVCAVVAERQRRPIVYRDQMGSTPFHRASFFRGVEHDRTSALTFNQVIAGSIPAYPTGCEAHQDEQAALNRQAERSIRSAPTKFVLG